MVNIDQLRQILDLVKEHELSEFEIEQEGLRLKVRKQPTGPVIDGPAVAPPTSGPPTPPAIAVAEIAAPDVDGELATVKSPIVGTFYRSSEPGAPPFVEVGSSVKKGQVLCIIEAMKLMNEIDSDYDGEVTNIYVENGHPVQYGERLFGIRTR